MGKVARVWGTTLVFLLTVTLVGSSATAEAVTISWADWTSHTVGSPGSAAGGIALSGGTTIGLSYSGQVSTPTQTTPGGTVYWLPSTPYVSATVSNPPTGSDIITLTGGGAAPITSTITFSQPVTNPVMAIVSLGQPGVLVDYVFGDETFDVLSFGPGFWGGPGTLTELPGSVLRGQEGHGAIRFIGTYSSIDWTVPTAEFWHGFTIGLAQPAQIPNPGALALVGLGLGVLVVRLAIRLRAPRAG